MNAPHSRENALVFFSNYTRQHSNELQGKTVIDLSAGSGYVSSLFENSQSHVLPFDLFPENNTFAKATCKSIDLQKTFPIESETADYVILSETIEHLSDQVLVFREVARILRPSGIFLLTTPNSSSLQSRFSQFVIESEHYGTPPPNEINAYVTWNKDQKYFGKLFVSGILRLRTMAAVNQLTLKKVHSSKKGSTSFVLLVFYPLIWMFSRLMMAKQVRKNSENRKIYYEIFRLNTSLRVVLCKHLLMEFEKKSHS